MRGDDDGLEDLSTSEEEDDDHSGGGSHNTHSDPSQESSDRAIKAQRSMDDVRKSLQGKDYTSADAMKKLRNVMM
jgi:hypothetical protein